MGVGVARRHRARLGLGRNLTRAEERNGAVELMDEEDDADADADADDLLSRLPVPEHMFRLQTSDFRLSMTCRVQS